MSGNRDRAAGHLASDVVLRDGSTVSLRPVRADDEPLLHGFFASLDERSLAFRFFTGAPNLEAVARLLAQVDQHRRFGLLALRGPGHRVVGHGFFAAIDDERAEVAFAVAKDLQAHGLGTILLAQLAERAAEEGFSTLVAEVMPENHAMVAMFRGSGLPVEIHAEPDAVVVEMPASAAPEGIARFQERDSIAARAAVAAVLDPDAVALVEGPPEAALERARGWTAAGARALVVRAAAGPAESEELLAICRDAGARLVGPGSLGVLDNRPGRELDLTGAERLPPPGALGIVTQGEPAGRELLDLAARRGIGVSTFVSLGARADVSANDLLEYWERDPATAVALLQVESFSDPRRFARVARRVSGELPIVVVAARAAAEPPGRGLFDQVGAIRATTAAAGLELAARLVDKAARRRRRKWVRPATVASPRDGHPRRRAASVRADEAAAILAAALAAEGTELDAGSRARFLGCHGIKVDETARPWRGATRLRVAVEADPLFGPVLRCGTPDEPPATMPARLCPLGPGDAAELLAAVAAPGLASLRPARRAALERTLEAVAAAAASQAEIGALEIDPLLITGRGVVAGGVRIRVRPPPERRPWPRTWE